MTKIESICDEVCKEFGITYSDLMSNRRWQDVADARHVAMTLCAKIVGRNLTLEHFKKHYDTQRHAERKVRGLIATYPAFKTKYLACEKVVTTSYLILPPNGA
jgi:chromosomal replication initiation ATPase DnaA